MMVINLRVAGNTGRAAIERALIFEPENAHYWHVKCALLAASGYCPGASLIGALLAVGMRKNSLKKLSEQSVARDGFEPSVYGL